MTRFGNFLFQILNLSSTSTRHFQQLKFTFLLIQIFQILSIIADFSLFINSFFNTIQIFLILLFHIVIAFF
nr:MAG TPA: hypothetical protein [Caudoviricetes sp.]